MMGDALDIETRQISYTNNCSGELAVQIREKMKEEDEAVGELDRGALETLTGNLSDFFAGERDMEEIGVGTPVANRLDFSGLRDLLDEEVSSVFKNRISKTVDNLRSKSLKDAVIRTTHYGEPWSKPTREGYVDTASVSLGLVFDEKGVAIQAGDEWLVDRKAESSKQVRVKYLSHEGGQLVLEDEHGGVGKPGTRLVDIIIGEGLKAYNREISQEKNIDFIDPTKRTGRPKIVNLS
jgi:hypothetical protein